MFTGIIESLGFVQKIHTEADNLRLEIACRFANELRVDQSVSHNGVCLTVVAVHPPTYDVVCIDETLKRSNLGLLQPGDAVNLERSMIAGGRIDGHFVQGHVDETGTIRKIVDNDGSRILFIRYSEVSPHITVEKGSVCVNGVSLTVVESGERAFSVALIPYTLEHTNLQFLKTGDSVNLEFDVLGKYMQKLARKN